MSPRIGMNLEIIIDAAAELANQEGMKGVTLSTLSKKLNVRPPSLYNHVSGLQGIQVELCVSGLEQLYEQMSSSVRGLTGEKALLALANAYMEFAHSSPGLYEASLLKVSDDRTEELSDRIVQLVVQLLIQFGYANEQTAIHAARGLRSMLHGFAVLMRQHAFELSQDISESFLFSIRAFAEGLQKACRSISKS
ncbi:TetR family transcriptional regulator [Bacillus atrophaeus]|uniref:TetR/AcrR family transcriptional regulator n=1 Tax=Bacillus atrophaeus TaxID=1452 RepID=UPI000D0426F7|nr:TetR-like C-terminal domain-containing protein [Bacillus atrophaeus]PRS03089.1 TetR family transcriptional regulator [Bacillus atrophaeus]